MFFELWNYFCNFLKFQRKFWGYFSGYFLPNWPSFLFPITLIENVMAYVSSHDNIRNLQDLLKTQKCKVLNMMELTIMKYQRLSLGSKSFSSLVEVNSNSFEVCVFHGNVFITCIVILCILYLLLSNLQHPGQIPKMKFVCWCFPVSFHFKQFPIEAVIRNFYGWPSKSVCLFKLVQ